jgi:predicted ATPase/class 3 adenylate cyclase
MRDDLPTGTLTFLFTDIEGSTKLAASLGNERWTPVLERHQEVLRECFTSRGGIEVATEGDSFFVVFPSAPAAVAAAVAAQQRFAAEPWPDGAAVRVRMGLHTGEGTLGADNYVGLDVHRAARVAAAGHGGQVLISAATRSLAQQNLPEGVTLRDLGEHRLKDLAQPERLAMLVVPGCPTEFPPLRTVDAVPNNLPLQLTSFIGREQEVAEVGRTLLDGARLVTLTGPGGTGKTRLSLQVAAEVSDRFPDGVFFVPLAPVSDASLVPSAIANALQIPVSGNQPVEERLRDWLKSKQILLVLDNFEQVAPAASLVADLLRSEESVRILVTSRAPLRVYGEREYPVPSMRMPAKLPDDPDRLSQFEAVRLFIERAVGVRPDFRVNNENAPAVAMICARLDGLPLAIELAAARIKVLSPQAILPRLQNSLDLLSTGARDLTERQRTLRGAITWSWDLLSDEQRRLFSRLGVFADGARLEQAEAVCSDGLGIDILDGLSELVDQSLVRQSEETDGEPRFWMLATIRDYALERLAESPDATEVRRRHAQAYADLAETAEPHLTGADQASWLARLDREHDNLRSAIEWAIAADDTELALRLISAPWRFWQFRGHLREAAQRQAAVLAMPSVAAADPRLRYRALEAAGGILYWSGDYRAAYRTYTESLDVARQTGDRALEAQALYNRAFTGEGEDPFLLMKTEGREASEQALAIWRELGDRRGVAQALWAIASAHQFSGELERARAEYLEALDIFREFGDRYYIGWTTVELGWISARELEWTAATRFLAEGLEAFAAAGDVSAAPLILTSLAWSAYNIGDLEEGFRLAGAASRLEREHGVGLTGVTSEFADIPSIPELIEKHPDQRPHFEAGEALDFPAAVAEALAWAATRSTEGTAERAPETPPPAR